MQAVTVRHAIDPATAKTLDTQALRDHFHVGGLFEPGKITLVYSHYDRLILGSVVPDGGTLELDAVQNTGTSTILERREMGILNVGETGTVTTEGKSYEMGRGDVLYIGMGAGPVAFSGPGRFYVLSAPAHQTYPTRLIKVEEAKRVELGAKESANERVILQFLHPDVHKTCQLTMGYTQFMPGSLWNTMPCHLHDRRMEAYLYFDLADEARVFHFMGRPEETRHIVMKNEEAVISPPWSIHSGAGTGSYTFCWAMAGDNADFTDMDMVAMEDLR
ncbi:5-dehydro-4-deoxy-D-glucuronate isomerase [Amaricoccus macauensis]|uniref:5-dehydro-4-deoxy-D-glucuronate isomerase n=1 Tax=Amaricoccus macauensis TaxID=57001 RepID=UPI003C7BF3B4